MTTEIITKLLYVGPKEILGISNVKLSETSEKLNFADFRNQRFDKLKKGDKFIIDSDPTIYKVKDPPAETYLTFTPPLGVILNKNAILYKVPRESRRHKFTTGSLLLPKKTLSQDARSKLQALQSQQTTSQQTTSTTDQLTEYSRSPWFDKTWDSMQTIRRLFNNRKTSLLKDHTLGARNINYTNISAPFIKEVHENFLEIFIDAFGFAGEIELAFYDAGELPLRQVYAVTPPYTDKSKVKLIDTTGTLSPTDTIVTENKQGIRISRSESSSSKIKIVAVGTASGANSLINEISILQK